MEKSKRRAWSKIHNFNAIMKELRELEDILREAAEAEEFLEEHNQLVQAKTAEIAELDQEIERTREEFDNLDASWQEKFKSKQDKAVAEHNRQINEFGAKKNSLEVEITNLSKLRDSLEDDVKDISNEYKVKKEQEEYNITEELFTLKKETEYWQENLRVAKKQAKEMLAGLAKGD